MSHRLLIIILLALPLNIQAGYVSSGTIKKVIGNAFIIRKGGKKQKIRNGLTVSQGDKIKILSGSRVLLVLKTGVRCQLKNYGIFSLDECVSGKKGNSTKISSLYGNISVSVSKLSKKNSMQLRTPTMVAGVRGTEFEATITDGITELLVYEGAVAVQDVEKKHSPQVINSGEGCRIKSGGGKMETFVQTTADSGSDKGESVDSMSPIIIFLDPPVDGMEVYANPYTISFTIVEENINRVLVNGKNIPTTDGQSITTDINLNPGKNTVVIYVIDKAGNSSQELKTIIYRPFPPAPPQR
jgi:FecR protein/Glucodextranase, domain B